MRRNLNWLFALPLLLCLAVAYNNCGGPRANLDDGSDGTGTGNPQLPGEPEIEYNSFIYVAAQGGVRAYSLDANKQLVPATVTGGPSNSNVLLSVAADPKGQYVFTSGFSPNTLLNTYSVNQTTGALTFVSSLQYGGQFPYSLRVDPKGEVIYAGDNDRQSVWAFRLNRTTGATTLIGEYNIGGTGSSYAELGIQPTGGSLYVMSGNTQIRQAAIGATGALSLTQSYNVSASHFTFAHDGRFLFAGNFGGNTIQTFAVASNGALTASPAINGGQGNLSRLQTDATGQYLFASAQGGSSIAAYAIGVNGELTFKSAANVPGANFFAITGDHTGTMVYASARTGNDVIHQFQLDRATGTLTKVGATFNNGSNVYGMTFLKVPKP